MKALMSKSCAARMIVCVLLCLLGVGIVAPTFAATMTWSWEATIFSFGSFPVGVPVPWDIAVGDSITGTFTIDYADVGVGDGPGIRRYYVQPVDNVTAVIDGIDVWLDTNAGHTNLIIDDNPPFNPNFEKVAISRFATDPRFSDYSVDGGVNFYGTGSSLANTDLPTSFNLAEFSSFFFLNIIGPIPTPDRTTSYHVSANLIRLSAEPLPLPATLSLLALGLAGLGFSRRNRAG